MSGLLLDTHVLLWWLDDPARIAADARATIADSASDVYVSSASVWEISIKTSKGRLRMPQPSDHHLTDAGLMPLAVLWSHAMAVAELEKHHQDPFDRLLIAQARVEGMTLVTRDPWMHRYDVPLLMA